MYSLVIIAFVIYILRIPERWIAGKVDFAGHSHNWWHLFVLAALYYWHNSGKIKLWFYVYYENFVYKNSLVLTFNKVD
jgi:predicted membrane channel-forming protein YqfA (hemolysin III family)